jgi:hypothetical protein
MSENYFICIDDDVFLRPSQITKLYKCLIKNQDVPHGVWGQKFYSENGELRCEGGYRNIETELDVMNRVYFFTRQHMNNFIELIKQLKFNNIQDLGFVDDIVLSFSGEGKPKCHIIGGILDCPTKDDDGVAVWKKHDFHSDRLQFYEKLENIKGIN